MKYPEPLGPKSQTELMAWLFTMLGNAYNMLAQHEADEQRKEDAHRAAQFRDVFERQEANSAFKQRVRTGETETDEPCM